MNSVKTLLVNSTRKEYIYLGNYYPDKLPYYLMKLEKWCSWNLIWDNIFVDHTYYNPDYENVLDKISF
jgi:hypothetical protein